MQISRLIEHLEYELDEAHLKGDKRAIADLREQLNEAYRKERRDTRPDLLVDDGDSDNPEWW